MSKIFWNQVQKLDVRKETRYGLFLALNSIFYALIGYVVWLIIGSQLFSNSWVWRLCFIGYPAILLGFLGGLLYIYSHE